MEMNLVRGIATLVLDEGNSETRGMVIYREEGKEVFRESFTRSNKFSLAKKLMKLDGTLNIPEQYTAGSSLVFDINTNVGNVPVQGIYTNGEVCERELYKTLIRPTAMIPKYENTTTVLSYIVGVYKAYEIIARRLNCNMKDLNIAWRTYLLLPPDNMEAGKGVLIDMMKSIKSIHFLYPDITLPLNVVECDVYPEGFCAYIGVLFDKDIKIRPDKANLTKSNVLVIDIGAGTLDLIIIENNKVVSESKKTIDYGGNQVMQYVKRELTKAGIYLSEEDIEQGTRIGQVRNGGDILSIVSLINAGKDETAGLMVNEIRDYFEQTQYPRAKINGILICGGGALEAENRDIHTLSDDIMKFMNKLTPNASLIELPQKIDEDGVSTPEISTRELNLYGGTVLASR